MRETRTTNPFPYPLALCAILTIASQTKVTAQSSDNVKPITPERVKTIGNHGMTQAQYPFDEFGKYRKEWVVVSAKSPVTSSTTDREPFPMEVVETSESIPTEPDGQPAAPERVLTFPNTQVENDNEAIQLGFIGPFSKMSSTPSVVPSITKQLSQKVLPLYHKVKSGDTLYAIGQEHNVSIDQIKKVNGLTDDLIKVGQTLRLVVTRHALGVAR